MKKIINGYLRRKVRIEDFDYQHQFEVAKKNNREFGLKVPEFSIDESFEVDKQQLLTFINFHVFNKPIEELAVNCFNICRELSALMNNHLSIKSIPTCGYVIEKYQGRFEKIFYDHKFFLKRHLGKKSIETLSLHCWITLPNLVIIDPTIQSTKVLNSRIAESYRQFFLLDGKYQNVESIYSYQPVFLGSEYFERLTITGKKIYIRKNYY